MATAPTNNYQGVNETQRFTLVDKFLGYRNREDKTLLAPGYMIEDSQNVLIDISGRLKNRKGYTLDGQADVTIAPMLGWFDWDEHKNGTINLRANQGKVQFRYVNSVGTVVWTTIITGLSTTNRVRFTNFWNNTEKQNVLLFVAHSPFVYEWNGATTTFASATAATITKQGTSTWAEAGFYVTANKQITIGGITYTYTGGEGTTTLTGVTPNPTLGGHVAGDLIYQNVITTANSAITSMLSTFVNDSISNLQNQIYYGSEASNDIYISQVNNYKSVAYTSPVRIVGEGALITLRSPFKAFAPQENAMYISAGNSQWYQTQLTLSSDNAKEAFQVTPLKTSSHQGSINQEATGHDRNSVVFISFEPRMVSLGRVDNIYQTPMMTDYSYPIANLMNEYDLTDASIKYWKSYVFVAVPREGKYLILNQTDPNNVFWEAPQTGSFAGFSIIDGDLYAQGYSVPETYKLYDSYSDNGNPIQTIARFAYSNFGDKANTKYFNEYWVSGYISANTLLTMQMNYDIDGCATDIQKTIAGDDTQIVCILSGDASLGKTSLGKHGLGTNSLVTGPDPLPPYFNVVKTMLRKDFYLYSPVFQSYGVDYRWELLAFGPLSTKTMYGNNVIKQ